jgi:hypothetical protein
MVMMKSFLRWLLLGFVLIGLLIIGWMSPLGTLLRDQDQLMVWIQVCQPGDNHSP